MKSHRLRLDDLLPFGGLDDLLLLEEVDPPLLPLLPLELSPFSISEKYYMEIKICLLNSPEMSARNVHSDQNVPQFYLKEHKLVSENIPTGKVFHKTILKLLQI